MDHLLSLGHRQVVLGALRAETMHTPMQARVMAAELIKAQAKRIKELEQKLADEQPGAGWEDRG